MSVEEGLLTRMESYQLRCQIGVDSQHRCIQCKLGVRDIQPHFKTWQKIHQSLYSTKSMVISIY